MSWTFAEAPEGICRLGAGFGWCRGSCGSAAIFHSYQLQGVEFFKDGMAVAVAVAVAMSVLVEIQEVSSVHRMYLYPHIVTSSRHFNLHSISSRPQLPLATA
jgi:hypothetical protein